MHHWRIKGTNAGNFFCEGDLTQLNLTLKPTAFDAYVHIGGTTKGVALTPFSSFAFSDQFSGFSLDLNANALVSRVQWAYIREFSTKGL